MISELVSALLAVTISVTTYATQAKPTQTYEIIQPNRQENVIQSSQRIQQSSTQTIQESICETFKDNCQEATKVFQCESGLRANAASQTGDFGVGQINLKAHWNKIRGETREEKITNLFDANYNLALSYTIYSSHGNWSAWRSSFQCHGLA